MLAYDLALWQLTLSGEQFLLCHAVDKGISVRPDVFQPNVSLTPRDVMDQAFAQLCGIVLTSQGVPSDNVTWEPPYVIMEYFCFVTPYYIPLGGSLLSYLIGKKCYHKFEPSPDSSGKGNDGQLMGDPAWVDGKFGSALEFNGASSHVSVPDSESLNPKTAVTLGAWIYPKGFTGNGNGLLTKEAQYILGLNWPQGGNAQKLNLWLTIGGWILFASDDEIPADSWSHVAVTYDGSTKKLYIDGNLVNLGVFNGADRQGEIGTSANNILIAQGNTGVGAQAFEGLIDEIAVFNIALTENDIKDFMKGWSFLLAVTPASKLTTTWAAVKACQ
jgi:hypothetical protein